MVKTDGCGDAPRGDGWPRSKFVKAISVLAAGLATAGAGLNFFAQATENPSVPASSENRTTAVIRDSLGQLKWVETAATDYTPLEAAGRRLYNDARCWYCHSQYSTPKADPENRWSPISDDKRRWGPAPEKGEYSYDNPLLFGAQGIAPDLAREGLKYGDEWHLAHFYNPPSLVKGSIMGGFSGLFDTPPEPVQIVSGGGGKTLERTAATERLFDFSNREQVKLTPNERGLLFVPSIAKGKYPVVWTPNNEYAGDTVKLVAETKEIQALVAYVQKLGTNRGRWREFVEPAEISGSDIVSERSEQAIAHGKEVYERRCIGCHGSKGDGNGEAATFLYKQRPRNFTAGVFKFRLTKGTLPTDRDLLRTINRGVRGTAMPPWYELPLEDRLGVIQYIKYGLAADRSDQQKPYFYFVEEPPPAPAEIGTPPQPTPDLIVHGHDIWQQAKCWECHGKTGKGDGEKAAGLKDDWSFPIRPANLTTGQFKSGPAPADLFRTITYGLSGSPMPSFKDAFAEADRWALTYYILSLSAFSDPLTGIELPIAPADRAALGNPGFQTAGPEHAYRLRTPEGARAAAQANVQTTDATRGNVQWKASPK